MSSGISKIHSDLRKSEPKPGVRALNSKFHGSRVFWSIVIILESIVIIFGSIVIIFGSIFIIFGSIITKLKITGHRGIFGENRDYKTVIREPFVNDFDLRDFSTPFCAIM